MPLLLKMGRVFSISFTIVMLSACKILTLEEDQLARAQQSGNFDVAKYVSDLWPNKVASYLADNAQEITTLSKDLGTMDISKLGGRQAGEGSPWTFIATGEGIIDTLDNESRQGFASLTLENGHSIDLLLGPVIFSTAIRDALPFINFNDFANQIVYAEVGNSLTSYALNNNAAVLQAISIGDRINFTGVFAVYNGEQAIRITPTSMLVLN